MDANPETLDGISKGVIAATIAQKPYTMAFYGLRFLDDLHHNSVHEFTDWRTAPASPLPASLDTGTTVVDVSLDRVRYLRATRDVSGSSEECAVKQGLLGPQWQRPELYDLVHPRPLREAAE